MDFYFCSKGAYLSQGNNKATPTAVPVCGTALQISYQARTAVDASTRHDENSTRFRFRPDSVKRVDSDDVGPATCRQVKLSAGASLVDDRYDCCLGVIVAPGLKMRLLDINGGVQWTMRRGADVYSERSSKG